MDRFGGAFSQAKTYAEKGRTHVNAGLKKVDDQWSQSRGGTGTGEATSPGLTAGGGGPPPPPPTRTGTSSGHSSGPPPPPVSRTRAGSNPPTSNMSSYSRPPLSSSSTSSASPSTGFSFINIDPREKEAFFQLLDEYFSSRPQFASLFSSSSSSTIPPPPTAPVTTATKPPSRGIGIATALYDFEGTQSEDLPFREGDKITILEIVSEDWWKGELNGREGIFPSSYAQMS